MPLNPHHYAAARRCAEHLRQTEQDDFWRGTHAIYARIHLGVVERLARSSTRFWSALDRRNQSALPKP